MADRVSICLEFFLLKLLRSHVKYISFDKNILFILSFSFLMACAKSPAPVVTSIVPLKPPTFNGASSRTYTIPSQIFTMSGECDPANPILEYSSRGGPWLILASGCVAGATFSQSVTVVQGYTEILVRAQGPGGSRSGVATAKVSFVLPPSSPFLTFVQSSKADSSDLAGPGSQNAMGMTFTGAPLTSVSHRLDTYVPGIVYAQ